jgi:hypothetical protein
LKRDEVEEEREGVKSLAQVEVEKVEAMDRRERHDEAEEEEEDVEAEVEVVEVEAKEGAKEARPGARLGSVRRGEGEGEGEGEAYVIRWSGRTCAGSGGDGALPAGPQCGA